ncbi:hypothetical protein Q0Z83_060890 [Actinoplanes sichuanensis]|uniref:hypothetical protein n=1 Tax=Actinoplanes sichuanensis TaxID=512349 RepID=UPI0029559044|nr:hypothetical protein [Actinoplanes sichuanensis]BEL07898.1 hypothetical protein Q0Z83_060890 [Actinoplanes sichuanensis]
MAYRPGHRPDHLAPAKDLELVAQRNLGKGVVCPGAYLTVEAADLVSAALARREKTITFGVRLAASAESDPNAWRSLRPLNLSMSTNHLPTVSGLRLRYPDRPCGTITDAPVAGGLAYFTANTADADPSSYPTTTFAIWPVDKPEERTPIGSGSGATPVVSTNLRSYADGTVLAWSAQAADYDDQGEWGETCYLRIDNTAPAAEPAILPRKYVETEYPGSGGSGVAGVFVLDRLEDQADLGQRRAG